MSSPSHRVPDKKLLKSIEEIAEILKTVPNGKEFHFYISIGNSTREIATSLENFEAKLRIVPADSVKFHLQRGDFQKWVENILGDYELARRISQIKLTVPIEDLRKELLAIVQTRITQLKREVPHQLRHLHS